MALGAPPGSEYLIGIFAKSCVEWTVAEFGCYSQDLITAPLYDSLGAEACHEVTDCCKCHPVNYNWNKSK